jgi:HAD superfamily hydrolase (TIGR01490 family)
MERVMALALFDLDNTLLAGDSDHAWGDFLCRHGIVDGDAYKARNDEFYQDYLSGKLDIREYLNFCLAVLGEHPQEQLNAWHAQFMAECIEPIILPAGEALLAKHRAAGDTVLIITATNRFVTGPIARRLGVEHLLATECEQVDGRYTGRTTDVPCFREGKVERLARWLKDTGHSLEGSYFYSDSHNDLPLLQQVSTPVAVDPDDTLRAQAEQAGWQVISLR